MRVISVNVGLPREVPTRQGPVLTAIWKTPVEGPVRVSTSLEGDAQADLSVHGGPYKAVYAYPSEHYAAWQRELGLAELPWGAFGENLTLEGLLESNVRIGDRLRIGTVDFEVTQPRMPCFKLNLRFDRDDMVKRFLQRGRPGFYLAVLQPGELAAGAPVKSLARDPHGVTVTDIAGLYSGQIDDADLLQRALAVPALPEGLKRQLEE